MLFLTEHNAWMNWDGIGMNFDKLGWNWDEFLTEHDAFLCRGSDDEIVPVSCISTHAAPPQSPLPCPYYYPYLSIILYYDVMLFYPIFGDEIKWACI